MKNLSEIIVILDRSGSMGTIKKATIDGYNRFLAEQKALDGKALLTLVQFDHDYEVVFSAIDLQEISPLTAATYKPRGTTALLDAIGKTIEDTRDRLVAKSEGAVPQLIFLIITDGEENSSRDYSLKQIYDLIRRGEEIYKWQFVFLGANQDAIKTGQSLGVLESKSMTFKSDARGAMNMFEDLSKNIAEVREKQTDFEFKPYQRRKQKR